METITTNPDRIGNFTSSEIYRLMSNGKTKGTYGAPFYSYIKETNMERRLGRSLTDEVNARPLAWGKLCEKRVFDLLPLGYELCSDITLVHPTIACWAGSPDVRRPSVVGDAKSPVTLKSFCQLLDPYCKDGVVVYPGLTIEALRENHKDGEKFYWQLVSNGILTDSDTAELIVYTPYKEELEDIRRLANDAPGDEMKNYYFIIGSQDEELPHLIEGGYYKNLNVISFPIPQADKDALTERVLAAEKLLIERVKIAA